jgi:hypothetical protein
MRMKIHFVSIDHLAGDADNLDQIISVFQDLLPLPGMMVLEKVVQHDEKNGLAVTLVRCPVCRLTIDAAVRDVTTPCTFLGLALAWDCGVCAAVATWCYYRVSRHDHPNRARFGLR